MLADVNCCWKMTSFMELDCVTSFLRLKDVTNTDKQIQRSLSIGGSSLECSSRAERKTIVTDIFMNSIFLHIFVPFCDVQVPSNFH